MKSFFVAMLVLSFFVQPFCGTVLADEEENTTEYSWGIVTKISGKIINVLEYDYDTDEDVEVVYAVDPEVELKNIDSLQDLQKGDNIEIDFVVKGEKRIAKVISLEGVLPEEDYYEPLEPEQIESEEDELY